MTPRFIGLGCSCGSPARQRTRDCSASNQCSATTMLAANLNWPANEFAVQRTEAYCPDGRCRDGGGFFRSR